MNEPEMSRTARAGGGAVQAGGLPPKGPALVPGWTCWRLAAGPGGPAPATPGDRLGAGA